MCACVCETSTSSGPTLASLRGFHQIPKKSSLTRARCLRTRIQSVALLAPGIPKQSPADKQSRCLSLLSHQFPVTSPEVRADRNRPRTPGTTRPPRALPLASAMELLIYDAVGPRFITADNAFGMRLTGETNGGGVTPERSVTLFPPARAFSLTDPYLRSPGYWRSPGAPFERGKIRDGFAGFRTAYPARSYKKSSRQAIRRIATAGNAISDARG